MLASMQSMSEDDAAYTELLTQLLSDSSSTRNARVHSWIEHQYDFAFSEQDPAANAPHSRPPSPSPSSSLGAHRTFSIDRPDSPLLPRSSADSPSSPRSDALPLLRHPFLSSVSSSLRRGPTRGTRTRTRPQIYRPRNGCPPQNTICPIYAKQAP
ncbi:hypothetical protein F5J12DRAFT_236170 [Pisolithus orientalis]|uniref:uncharacterized protein n=1 Tax=Pisolithus orientalis TaxID=936130 RepID=UPI0022251283|nr:uncharacterized protein F5J12DRAFT_236170 [Pisolithus orientalis]KAI6001553.1 hypothetical protein F5J12DRAFT_236170 [Pisolithus orientalis]